MNKPSKNEINCPACDGEKETTHWIDGELSTDICGRCNGKGKIIKPSKKTEWGRSGKDSPNWKGEKAGKAAMHKWMDNHYGKPKHCENPNCDSKATWFDWCIKRGRKYSHNRKDYLRLCRSCHRRYDMTEEKLNKAIENLWWMKGVPCPGVPFFKKGNKYGGKKKQ